MEVRRFGAARAELIAILVLAVLVAAAPAAAQRQAASTPADKTGAPGPPNVAELIAAAADESDLRVVVRRFELDQALLGRRYDVPLSPVRIGRKRSFLNGWLNRLAALDPGRLNEAGRRDYAKLRETVEAGLRELGEQEVRVAAMAPLLPFVRPLQILQEKRRDRLDVDPFGAAQTIEDARKEVVRLTGVLADQGPAGFPTITPRVAADTVGYLESLEAVLKDWYEFYYGFDPLFTWWAQTPYRELTEVLEAYRSAIRRAWPAG
jgi:hypothetical protein